VEKQLIIASKKQDKKAFEALYHQYKRYWFTICLRYNQDREDAQDCLQNALVKMYNNIERFDENKGNLKAWSSKIVVNESLSFIKSRQSKLTEQLDETNVIAYETYEESSTLSKKNIIKLIQKLPKGYRQVFNMYVFDGFSHAEISEVLGISVGASKSQLFKARKMLQSIVTCEIETRA